MFGEYESALVQLARAASQFAEENDLYSYFVSARSGDQAASLEARSVQAVEV